jgi:hypothetical protein
MKRIAIYIGLSLLSVSSLIVVKSVLAQGNPTTTHTRTSLSANLLNPCNGEFVATQAEQLMVFHVTHDADGGLHVHVTTNIQGTGTGLTTGAKYQLSAVATANFNSNGATEQNLWQDFVFNGQGSVPNFLVQEEEHFTINANGDVTVDHEQFFTKCN